MTTGAETRVANGGSRRPWWLLVLFLAVIALGLVALLVASRLEPDGRRHAFETQLRRKISRAKPHFVLVGNSMVGTRFHERTLNRLIAPVRTVVYGGGGSKSAVWYLTLKYSVLVEGVRPPNILLFFRDTELTSPRERALGVEHYRLEVAAPIVDPVVESKLAPPIRQQPVGWLGWHLDRFAPLARLRARTDEPLDRLAVFTSSLVQPEPDVARRKQEINELFALSNLRVADAPVEPEAEAQGMVFEQVVNGSLLPDIIELARSHGAPLTLIRVRSRLAAEGGQESPELRRYIAALARYAAQHAVRFVDMRDASWEAIELYGNGDHIAGRYKRHYTELFVQNMAHVFR